MLASTAGSSECVRLLWPLVVFHGQECSVTILEVTQWEDVSLLPLMFIASINCIVFSIIVYMLLFFKVTQYLKLSYYNASRALRRDPGKSNTSRRETRHEVLLCPTTWTEAVIDSETSGHWEQLLFLYILS